MAAQAGTVDPRNPLLAEAAEKECAAAGKLFRNAEG